MALKYRVLEKFSQEAREYAAARVYDRKGGFGGRVCADGRCVLANLLFIDKHVEVAQPSADTVCDAMGYSARGPYGAQLACVIDLNDGGKLATPEAVRALLLGEDAPQEATV